MHIYTIYQLFTSPYSKYLADYAKVSANVLFVRKKIEEQGSTPKLQQELAAAENALDAEYAKVKAVYDSISQKDENLESLNSIVEADYKVTRK